MSEDERIAKVALYANADAIREGLRLMQSAKPFDPMAKHEDRIEHLAPPFYIRWTRGPDYERAYLCVDDGEADMRDFAEVSFGMARLFKAALTAALTKGKEHDAS